MRWLSTEHAEGALCFAEGCIIENEDTQLFYVLSNL